MRRVHLPPDSFRRVDLQPVRGHHVAGRGGEVFRVDHLQRRVRDPQRYANRLMSLMMSILGTGAKSGVLYETGAFANPKKAKTDWAKVGSAIEVSPGAISGGKIMPKPQQAMPPAAPPP